MQPDMIAKCSFEEVTRANPITLSHLLFKRVSFVGKLCIMLGVLLCWAPMIGVIPAVIGFCYRKQFGHALRVARIIGLILSLLTTAFGIVAICYSRTCG